MFPESSAGWLSCALLLIWFGWWSWRLWRQHRLIRIATASIGTLQTLVTPLAEYQTKLEELREAGSEELTRYPKSDDFFDKYATPSQAALISSHLRTIFIAGCHESTLDA